VAETRLQHVPPWRKARFDESQRRAKRMDMDEREFTSPVASSTARARTAGIRVTDHGLGTGSFFPHLPALVGRDVKHHKSCFGKNVPVPVIQAVNGYGIRTAVGMKNRDAAQQIHYQSRQQEPRMALMGTDENHEFIGSVSGLIRVYQCHPRLKSSRSKKIRLIVAGYLCVDAVGRPVERAWFSRNFCFKPGHLPSAEFSS